MGFLKSLVLKLFVLTVALTHGQVLDDQMHLHLNFKLQGHDVGQRINQEKAVSLFRSILSMIKDHAYLSSDEVVELGLVNVVSKKQWEVRVTLGEVDPIEIAEAKEHLTNLLQENGVSGMFSDSNTHVVSVRTDAADLFDEAQSSVVLKYFATPTQLDLSNPSVSSFEENKIEENKIEEDEIDEMQPVRVARQMSTTTSTGVDFVTTTTDVVVNPGIPTFDEAMLDANSNTSRLVIQVALSVGFAYNADNKAMAFDSTCPLFTGGPLGVQIEAIRVDVATAVAMAANIDTDDILYAEFKCVDMGPFGVVTVEVAVSRDVLTKPRDLYCLDLDGILRGATLLNSPVFNLAGNILPTQLINVDCVTRTEGNLNGDNVPQPSYPTIEIVEEFTSSNKINDKLHELLANFGYLNVVGGCPTVSVVADPANQKIRFKDKCEESVEFVFIATDGCGVSIASPLFRFTVVDTTPAVVVAEPESIVVECSRTDNRAELTEWAARHAGYKANDKRNPNPAQCRIPDNEVERLPGQSDEEYRCPYCSTEYDPVCVNGEDYFNSCYAYCHGAQGPAYQHGTCASLEPVPCAYCAGTIQIVCAEGIYQFLNPCEAYCHGYSTFAYQPCMMAPPPPPEPCAHCNNQYLADVCGGDGVTYESPCHAECHNVYVYTPGFCAPSPPPPCGDAPLIYSNNLTQAASDSLLVGNAAERVISVEFTATDPCGNNVSRIADFTAKDTIKPYVVNGAATKVQCDNTTNLADFNAYVNNRGGATANDRCSSNLQWALGDIKVLINDGCKYKRLVTFTVDDGHGNIGKSQGRFNIVDNDDPYFVTPPQDIVYECGVDNAALVESYINNYGGATAVDDCVWENPTDLTWMLPPVPSTIPSKCYTKIPLFFEVKDACGHVTGAVGSVSFEDTTPPVITQQPEPMTIIAEDKNSAAAVNEWIRTAGGASGLDGCGNTVSFTYPPFTAVPVTPCSKEIRLRFNATDECGNSVMTNEAVLVLEDREGPTLSPVANKNWECNADGREIKLAKQLAANFGAKCTDYDGTSNLLQSSSSAWIYPDGNVPTSCKDKYAEVSISCYDACSVGAAPTIVTVNVRDTTPPVITGGSDLIHYCDDRCLSDLPGQQDKAKQLFQRWLSSGCLSSDDLCNSMEQNYTIIHGGMSAGEVFDMDKLCGTSGHVIFNVYDMCGNMATKTLGYAFPSIPGPQTYSPTIPINSPVQTVSFVNNPQQDCVLCGSPVDSSKKFALLKYVWQGSSGVSISVFGGYTGTVTLNYGDIIEITDPFGLPPTLHAKVSLYWMDAIVEQNELLYHACDAPTAATYGVGHSIVFKKLGALVLLDYLSMEKRTAADDCGVSTIAYTLESPPPNVVLERGCCYTFITTPLFVYDVYQHTKPGAECVEEDYQGGGRRFARGIQCGNLREQHANEMAAVASPPPDPATCGDLVDTVDECVIPPIPDVVKLILAPGSPGCCFFERLSYATSTAIHGFYVQSDVEDCDLTVDGMKFQPHGVCELLKLEHAVNTNTMGCCYYDDRKSGTSEYYGHKDMHAGFCEVTSDPSLLVHTAFHADITCSQLIYQQTYNGNQNDTTTIGGCEPNFCDFRADANDKPTSVRVVLVNEKDVFIHNQPDNWNKLSLSVYMGSLPTRIAAYKSKSEELMAPVIADVGTVLDVFPPHGKSVIKGKFLRFPIGQKDDKINVQFGIDCKKGRELRLGDQYGVLKVVGFSSAAGTCNLAGYPVYRNNRSSRSNEVQEDSVSIEESKTDNSGTPSAVIAVVSVCAVLVVLTIGTAYYLRHRKTEVYNAPGLIALSDTSGEMDLSAGMPYSEGVAEGVSTLEKF
eukprot:m.12056 g.12056  ORF g.12056 m.12056 type:complete len:1829 (+) comp4579_c0_seq1:73-5559(+)